MRKTLSILSLLMPVIAAGAVPEYDVTGNGKTLPVEKFKDWHYVSCTVDGRTDFAVTPSGPVSEVEISPLSRNIKAELDGSTIRFSLQKTGQYLVRINDTTELFIFAEKPVQEVAGKNIMDYAGIDNTGGTDVTAIVQKAIDECAAEGETLVFPSGTYLCTQLRLPSHTHLHLARGAVILADPVSAAPYESDDNVKTRRFIYVKDAHDVSITGLGAIDGNGRALRERFGDGARIRLMLAVNSSDLHFEGVMFRDPGSWNTQILRCRDVVIRNVKLMNDFNISNTDGFDPDASHNVLIENCFAYCSDDNVAIKTTGYSGYIGNVKGITVHGCVFLTKKSSLKVGTETRGAYMEDILFEDNDVLLSDRGMALYVSDGTDLRRVRYIDNRFERCYEKGKGKRMMFQFQVNPRHDDSPVGAIRDVLVRNCSFVSPFPKSPELECPAEGDIEDIVFENLQVGGKPVLSPEQIGLKTVNAKAVFRQQASPSAGIYDKPLKTVLDEVEERYGVELVYEEKNVRDRIVISAPWRFYEDVEATLDNILRPLDLRWTEKSPGVYEIKKWEYFRKPAEEGGRHLDRLLELYPDKASFEARKDRIRKHIFSVLGLDNLKKCDLAPVRSNLRSHDGYTVENIALEILPGVWVSGSLYKPEKVEGKIPVMLSPHGHFYNKTDHSIPDERGRYRPDQQIRCAMLAKMGAAVFSYDMWAWGESALAFNPKDHRSDLGIIMQTWQSIRILDWICAQDWCDTDRVGVTGASGGGTQTMLITALDDRIRLSVPVVMLSSHFFGGCPCESGLPVHILPGEEMTNNAEIGAMAAPRPQLVISDGHDWTSTVPKLEYPYLQKVYGLYGARKNVRNVHFPDEDHDYGASKRRAMYDFVAEQFGLDTGGLVNPDGSYKEETVTVEHAQEMYVFGEKGQLPSHAVLGGKALRSLLQTYRNDK